MNQATPITVDMPKLGFGLMRLPKTFHGEEVIDIDATSRLADRFLAAGYRYFDTAYVYDGGDSERAFKRAVADRYPRDAYWITDKLPLWKVDEHTSMRDILDISLAHLGVDKLDLYLLHGLGKDSYAQSEKLGAWQFMQKTKEAGLTEHIGFSFHDTPDVLDKILTAHPETEFVQLQVNYADWNNPRVQSRACYETARAHGAQVLIMEPVKGGSLAVLPSDLRSILATAEPDRSIASWAIRFVLELPGVFCVLSGMNDLSQMEDNIASFDHPEPLDEDEHAAIDQVVAGLDRIPLIGCTECHYCTADCPEHIDVPGFIDQLNQYELYGYKAPSQRRYDLAVHDGGDPANCRHCGICEDRCPQHLPIRDILEKAVATFGA